MSNQNRILRVMTYGALCLMPVLLSLSAYGQKPHREVDTTPTLGEVSVNRERLSIDYKVPYDGIAEFKVYGPDSLKTFHENYRCFIGLNNIRLKFNNPKSGTYSYLLEYKGHEIKSTFEIR